MAENNIAHEHNATAIYVGQTGSQGVTGVLNLQGCVI